MALGDVSIVYPGGQNLPASQRFRTEAAGTAINAGEPVVIGGTGSNYVVPLADGTPTTTNRMLGIASSTSTQTASADGVVDVILAVPGIVYRCAATTPANIDTDAELLAILNDRVAFDLASGTYTVDENQGDNSANGLRIIGGDIVNGTLDFITMVGATNLT